MFRSTSWAALVAILSSSPILGAQEGVGTEGAPAPAAAEPKAAEPESPVQADAAIRANVAIGGKKKSDKIGIDVGVRAGYAVPLGMIGRAQTQQVNPLVISQRTLHNEEVRLRNTFDGHLPLQLDLGYRITDNIVVGAYGIYAPGFMAGKSIVTCSDQPTPDADAMMPDDVNAEVACSANFMRFGVQARYHFKPDDKIDPWVGLGGGLESFSVKNNDVAKSAVTDPNSAPLVKSFEGSGFEVSGSFGLDARVIGDLTFGPYFNFAIAKYTDLSLSCVGADCWTFDDELEPEGMHYWATGGVRAGYVF